MDLRPLILAVLLFAGGAGCRYHARPDVDDGAPGCRTHCADVHQRCVEGGEAKRLGLPGVTYDACRREQEDCVAGCPPDRELGHGSVPQPEPATEGVSWQPGETAARCPAAGASLAIPDQVAGAVHRQGLDELIIDLLPDAVLLIRGGPGDPPPVLEDWIRLQDRLVSLPRDSVSVRLPDQAVRLDAERFDIEYTVLDGDREVSFRAASRTLRAPGGYCTVIAVDRSGASPERSAVALLKGLGSNRPDSGRPAAL